MTRRERVIALAVAFGFLAAAYLEDPAGGDDDVPVACDWSVIDDTGAEGCLGDAPVTTSTLAPCPEGTAHYWTEETQTITCESTLIAVPVMPEPVPVVTTPRYTG